MKLCTKAEGLVRRPPQPNSPTVTVYFAGQESRDLGLVRVAIPPGAGMPPHRHGGSDVILAPTTGSVRITHGDEEIEVHVGDAALITREETVSLTNSGDQEAELIVAAGPANFVAGILSWPDPTMG